MNIVSRSRNIADFSNAKLRRARKLYQFICAPAIQLKPDYAIVTANRAKEAGLYAKSTSLGDVTFAMERGCYRRFSKERGNIARDHAWLHWCQLRRDDTFWSTWEKAKYIARKYSRFGKTKVRLKL